MADFDFSKSDIELLKEFLTYPNDFRYPVGTILISNDDEFNPCDEYGGEWEKIEDRLLLAAGTTFKAGATGGEIEHTLTIDEMPSHSHSTIDGFEDGGITTNRNSLYSIKSTKTGWGNLLGYAGNSQPHNNMPPYKAMYMWIKTKTQKQKEMEGSV